MDSWCQPGQTAIVRDVYRGRVRSAVAMLVVSDEPERVVLYLPRGSAFALPADRLGRLTKEFLGFDHLAEIRWEAPKQVVIAARDTHHAVIVRFADTAAHEITEWYVNLQAPLVRTGLGFDTTDYALDVVISPDRRRWKWKDEDELAGLVDAGHFTAEEAEEFYREGRRVVEAARAGRPPFDEGWEHWRPDAGWRAATELPGGWSVADMSAR